jgi:hypothetical protein
MNEKKYLIYLDILGFERLAEEIEEERGIESREVREKFIDVINERVKTIERRGRITGKRYGESDDWLLLTDSLENAFKSILEILDHHTPYKGYEKIPLEIAIGTGEYDKWARFEGKELIIEKSTIKFIKTKIVGYYHGWYKQKHNSQSPKSTFIILTESAYHELEPLDRKICQKIEYRYKKDGGKEEVIIFSVADVDRVQQRGRVFEFLEKIGYAGSKWYGRIDEVYVPPLEYEDMERTLQEKRILFITGTQEYGKTYTAVRLMWEYYNSGYEPGWIKGGELTERIEVREKLENISAELKSGHIIYFEDPFGRTKYEKREGLEREIGTIINTVKQVEDVYVIITSRDEVFKEFKKEKLSAKDLKEFEKKLNVKKPSYGYKKRKKILIKWAEEENCRWLGNEKLKELVLESIKDEKILPTPLSIKDFAVATFEIEKEDELIEKIEEKSKETAKAFAEEIKNMTDDMILFLSFPFISTFKVEFVRAMYQKLVEELALKDAWEFDRVLNWFKDDKIDINVPSYLRTLRETSQFKDDKYSINDEGIKFSHSSYSEALPYLLVEDGYITRINREIFSKLLFKLSEKDKAAKIVALKVDMNFFDNLSEDTRSGLLFKLSESDKAAWIVARLVSNYFDRLTEDVKSGLLFKLSERGYLFNWDNVPGDDNEKLKEFLRDDFGIKWTENAKIRKFNDGKTIRILKDKNSAEIKINEKKEEATLNIGDGIIHYLKFKYENGKLNIYKSDTAAWAVAQTVAEHFTELPECVRNLLDRLQKDFQARIDDLTGKMEDEIELVESDAYGVSGEDFMLMQLESYQKLGAIDLISNARSKIDKKFALDTLGRLSEDWDEEVRTKAKALMSTISEDLKGNKKC